MIWQKIIKRKIDCLYQACLIVFGVSNTQAIVKLLK